MPSRTDGARRLAIAALGAAMVVGACGRSSPPASPPKAVGPAPSPSGAGVNQPAEASPAIPGWQAAFAAGGEGSPAVKGHTASAAFALGEGESVDPAVAPSGFTAGYTGVVAVGEPGKYRFGVEAQGGQARLTAFDKAGGRLGEAAGVWTPWLDLPSGPVTVAVQFTRKGGGAARLRTVWEKEGASGFHAEPIPPGVVEVPRFGRGETAAADAALRGRVLLGELGCTNCHSGGERAGVVLTQKRGPVLTEVGKRASPQWLTAWIAHPQRVKPGTGMPEVLGESAGDKADADAIVHYLASLGGPSEWKAAAAEPRAIEQGRMLYHTIGCVACHGPLEGTGKVFADGSAEAAPEFAAPSPLGQLAGKWRPEALSEFLQDPRASRPSGRMPGMSLKPAEADAIAAYLENFWGQGSSEPAFVVEMTKAAAGKAAFAARGCAACHEAGSGEEKVRSTLKAKAFTEIKASGGCLDGSGPMSPRYSLSERDRADLAAGIAATQRALAAAPAKSPIDEGRRLIAALGCRNCHSKDGEGGPPESIKPYFRTVDSTELGDEGRFPPHLSGVGMKLRSDWIKTVLTGAGRARPYIATRMPQFGPEVVGHLGELLAAMDGVVPGSDEASAKAADEQVLAGRRLIGEHGMNCISCHAYAGKTAGTAGPDITLFSQRLRREWFRAYILAPTRFKPGTRMTEFYKGGRGVFTDVYDGDPARQSEALWAYFAAGDARPAPEGLPTEKAIPIIPGERPVVFRTFLKGVGNRGIAVGYPIGIHFGFDAEGVRLAEVWKGDFVDATGAWKGRAGEQIAAQGQVVWTAPAGPPLVIGGKPDGSWPADAGAEAGYHFHGYRVEKDGTPVFMYEIRSGAEGAAPVQVIERFTPRPASGALFARRFEVSGVPAGAAVWINAGKGRSAAAAEGGAKIEETKGEDGAVWWGVTPLGGSAVFTLEVTP